MLAVMSLLLLAALVVVAESYLKSSNIKRGDPKSEIKFEMTLTNTRELAE
jgi:hypothetical protein